MSKSISPLSLSRRSPAKSSTLDTSLRLLPPTASLNDHTKDLITSLHAQQGQIVQVVKENREMEERLVRMEEEVRSLRREQAEADLLISNLVDIFSCSKPKSDLQTQGLEKEHPMLFSRLKHFRERLESFLDQKSTSSRTNVK